MFNPRTSFQQHTEGREIPALCSGSVSSTLIYLYTKYTYFTKQKALSTHVSYTGKKIKGGRNRQVKFRLEITCVQEII